MTSGSGLGSRLIVVGVDPDGVEVARLALVHGDDPTKLLAAHGWDVRRVRDVVRHPVERCVLTATFVVEPSFAQPRAVAPRAMRSPPHRDDDLAPVGGEVTLRHQRVAAYAVVTSSRGFLMTQFSDQTGAPGQWGLPGGGLEAEEAPESAVVREVWEESGQMIELSGLSLIRTSHWVGRAPGGQLEDFHAVRVVYTAICPEPTQPVVHDVGGTTESAAWFLPEDLHRLELTSAWRSILRDVAGPGGSGEDGSAAVMAPDETDGADHHHHHTDADDAARPQP